jgi:hypothetical protein
MPDHGASLRRLVPVSLGILVLATSGMLAAGSPMEARKRVPSREEQLRLMWAMAGQESGWDYYARNRTSGAYGKYQIMPFNWPAWAQTYLGSREADQTPWNQERVAYGKLRDLHGWLGSWRRVAYWWLTGSSERNEKRWSAYARGYVANIMRLRKRAPQGGGGMPSRAASSPSRGDWRIVVGSQRLRLGPAGRVWPARGRLLDGQVLKVRRVKVVASGVRWLRVVSADGRLGWLRQQRSVPARRPARAVRWDTVRDRGAQVRRQDRSLVRPRPR